MGANPILGVSLQWLGGLAAGSFYLPYRRVRGWSWETYWLAGGMVSWVVMPWAMAWLMTRSLLPVLLGVPASSVGWAYFLGLLWGVGGLTFGLAVRYLGMSLGYALVLGNCAVFGTLVPPIFHGQFVQLLSQRSGIVTLAGVGVCALGVVLAGAAGVSKEKELSAEQKEASVQEFNLKLGLAVAVFAGVMSACFVFGLDAGNPIKALTVAYGTSNLWQGLPVLVVVLGGGFTTNLVWCFALNFRNRSFGEYARIPSADAGAETVLDPKKRAGKRPSLAGNYIFSGLAGAIWYMQVFFYTMGESQMGRYKFSSWTLLNASIIMFSTLWGIALKEWRGVSARTKALVFLTLLTLVGSTMIVGYGSYLASH
jgi:L-rhamnose-H+ transport protein